ncbi:MAG TPA: Rpn family recombination-promoting nuclease/putative transposase [Candidatus Nanopelagicales bacterium]|nr:Rpn family recombination-promoting nuclease/putative transposase [Candidatus Nanopelagicales bacterium]
MRPLFADPRTDFVFKKIFGTEEHKPVLMAFLNHLLELDEAHRITDVELLSPEQRPHVDGLKHSIVDVKCIDARGTIYVVEMQVLNVEGFEKRVVYNAAKAYVGQLGAGNPYPQLNDVIGVSICDFELWPKSKPPHVPMLSRWRMQEQHGGAHGLGQLQFVFLELPKYDISRSPEGVVETWAYFFRAANELREIPEVLAREPFREALEAARSARFTEEEWEDYIRAQIALQDERGALSLAEKQGLQRGLKQGHEEGQIDTLRASVRRILARRGLPLSPEQDARIEACSDVATLERWQDEAIVAASAAEALG